MVSPPIPQPRQHPQPWATGIALAFHLSGVVAIGVFKSALFVRLTPLNLLVCLLLVLWTQPRRNRPFWIFCITAAVTGFAAEWVGINHGLLFGQYKYGQVLGPGWQGVPFLIGVQWLVTMYCCGIAVQMLHQRFIKSQAGLYSTFPPWLMRITLVTDAAFLAVAFDWILEPVAVQLGYWQWQNNQIPWSNYLSWWGVSLVILTAFQRLSFTKHNLFAVHLLLIQTMFFLILRTLVQFHQL